MAVIYPVIMAGGSGTRLWPLSRKKCPKQFQKVFGDHSMFQQTVLRVQGAAGSHQFGPVSVIGGEPFAELIHSQLDEIGASPEKIVLEPFGRNTAAVAAISAAIPPDRDALVLLLPSDHHITDPDAFRAAVGAAAETAEQGYLTTFGIAARAPETGYGYIQRGEELAPGSYVFEAFKEKPNLEKAKAYVADGRFSWNAGIFLYPAALMEIELAKHAPQIQAQAVKAMQAGRTNGPTLLLDPELFDTVDEDSIDYAVMEKTDRGAVCGPLECGWNDIGSWSAVADLSNSSDEGDVICIDTKGSYVRSDGDTLITTIGVEDLIIVAHEGSVLVARKDRSQDVKEIVNRLKTDKRSDKL